MREQVGENALKHQNVQIKTNINNSETSIPKVEEEKKQPPENALEEQGNQSQVSEVIPSGESKPNGDYREVDRNEAHQIAQERGYQSKVTAFGQWFSDHKGKRLHGIEKSPKHGKYLVFEESIENLQQS